MDNETAIHLIEMYASQSPLWDTRLKEYHNNNVREDLWDEIAKKIIQPKAVLKAKMKSLLSSYRRERNREKTSNVTGCGRNKAYKSKWFAYKAFSFLHGSNNPIDALESRDSTMDEDSTLGETPRATTARQYAFKKARKDEQYVNVVYERKDETTGAYYHWGMACAADLQKMERTQRIYAKKAIADIIMEGQLGLLHRHSVKINETITYVHNNKSSLVQFDAPSSPSYSNPLPSPKYAIPLSSPSQTTNSIPSPSYMPCNDEFPRKSESSMYTAGKITTNAEDTEEPRS